MSDWRCVEELRRRCDRFLADTRQHLMVDLTNVKTADSKLVACLVILFRIARARGLQLVVRPSTEVRCWFALCRLEGLLNLCARGPGRVSRTRVKHTLTDAWQAAAWNMGLLNGGSSAAVERQSMNTTIDDYLRRKTP